MKRNIFRSAKLQKQFVEKGYVKIALSNPEMLDKLKSEIAQLNPDDKFDPVTNRINPFAMRLHCTFLDTNKQYKKDTQELILRYFEPVINEFLIDYSFISGNIFVKQPGEGMLHLHQNWSVTEYPHTCLTLWVPMHDVHESNGALQVVEASHKIVPYIPTPKQGDYFNRFTRELKENHLTPIPLKFGEAVIFCESIIHGSPTNKSESPRTALQIAVYPSECTPVIFKLDQMAKTFNLHQIDPSFFIDHSIEAALQPTPEMKVIKQVPNLNKELSYEEFLHCMEQGKYRRQRLYQNGEVVQEDFVTGPASQRSETDNVSIGSWRRLFSFFKS